MVAASQAKNRSIKELNISDSSEVFGPAQIKVHIVFHSIPPSSNALCFVLLLNIPVHSYGHVGMVTSNFVGLLLDTEMNDTLSPAIRHPPY